MQRGHRVGWLDQMSVQLSTAFQWLASTADEEQFCTKSELHPRRKPIGGKSIRSIRKRLRAHIIGSTLGSNTLFEQSEQTDHKWLLSKLWWAFSNRNWFVLSIRWSHELKLRQLRRISTTIQTVISEVSFEDPLSTNCASIASSSFARNEQWGSYMTAMEKQHSIIYRTKHSTVPTQKHFVLSSSSASRSVQQGGRTSYY